MKAFRRRAVGKGFTLIELLVVVAIIGILAAIALSKLSNAIYQAKYGKANADLESMRSALHVFLGVHQYLPKDEGVGSMPEGLEQFLSVWPKNPFGDQLDGYDWDCFDYPGPAPYDAVATTQWCGIRYRGANGIDEIDWGDWETVTYPDWKNAPGDDLFMPVGNMVPVYWHY